MSALILLLLALLVPARSEARNKAAWDQPVGNYEQVEYNAKSYMVAYPNPELTPGVYRPEVSRTEICSPGYSKNYRKELSKVEKVEVYKRYDVPYDTTKYQIDHFIPISIGGSHDPENLWPQPIVNNAGFYEKQQVAQYLHEAVCRGDLELEDARSVIRRDWHDAWKRIQAEKEAKKKANAKTAPTPALKKK